MNIKDKIRKFETPRCSQRLLRAGRKIKLSIILIILVTNLFGNDTPKCDTLFWNNKKVRQLECRNSKINSLNDYKFVFDSFGNKQEEWVYKNHVYKIISFWKNKVQLVKYGTGYFESSYISYDIKAKGHFNESIKTDTWSFFYPNGKLSHKIEYTFCQNCNCCNDLYLENGKLIIALDTNGLIIAKSGNGYFDTYDENGMKENKVFFNNNITDSVYTYMNNRLLNVRANLATSSYLQIIREYDENEKIKNENKMIKDTFYSISYYKNGEIEIITKHYDSFTHTKSFYFDGKPRLDLLRINGTSPSRNGIDELWTRQVYLKEWDEFGNELK